jgi:GT2 family glycosyltransferase
VAVELSFCVVSTEQRQLLRYCLDAIARERAAVPFETEVLVLDNASRDGSADAARAHPATTAVFAADERGGDGERRTELLRRASGRFCLLLSEAAELEPGATAALHDALAGDERAAAAGPTLVDVEGRPRPSAWRFPGPAAALLGVAGLHARGVVQSRGERVRPVQWCSPAALLVRRDAALTAGDPDPALVDNSHGAELGRRLRDAGWRVLFVPEARAVRHEAVAPPGDPRESMRAHARDRDRYVRGHHSGAAAAVVRWLTAVRHSARALWRLVRGRPGEARAERLRAAAELFPGRDDA